MARPKKFTEEWARDAALKIPKLFEGGRDVVQVLVDLNISKSNYYELVEQYDFFKKAHEEGKRASEAYWLGICQFAASGAKTKGKNGEKGERYKGNAYMLNKIMNNKFGWYDKKEEIKEVVEKVTEKGVDKKLLKKIKDELDA